MESSNGNFKRWDGKAHNLAIHETGSLVSLPQVTDNTHDNAFDLEGVSRLHEKRLHSIVRGMELHGATFPVIGLDRGFTIHQSNHRLTIASGRDHRSVVAETHSADQKTDLDQFVQLG